MTGKNVYHLTGWAVVIIMATAAAAIPKLRLMNRER